MRTDFGSESERGVQACRADQLKEFEKEGRREVRGLHMTEDIRTNKDKPPFRGAKLQHEKGTSSGADLVPFTSRNVCKWACVTISNASNYPATINFEISAAGCRRDGTMTTRVQGMTACGHFLLASFHQETPFFSTGAPALGRPEARARRWSCRRDQTTTTTDFFGFMFPTAATTHVEHLDNDNNVDHAYIVASYIDVDDDNILVDIDIDHVLDDDILAIAVTVSASAAGSAASETTSATTGATSNTGTIIGGVAAGILGFAFLLAALAFIVRRLRRKKDEQIDFDPNSFRRSALQIHDDNFNPSPPVMTENRNNAGMSFGAMYGAPGPQPQYAQSQYSPSVTSSNINSANPLFAPAMYGHNQYSPSLRTAHTSGPVQYATYPAVPASSTREEPLPTSDYVDVERSSVTPFQAAQYVEISKRINSDPPRGLDTPAVEQYMHHRNDSLPPVPPKDPFDDPSSPVKSGSHHPSTSTASSEVMPHGELDFPVPPSPAQTTSSRYRIDSMPPSLPEIKMDPHHSVSSYNFPRDSTLMSTGPKKDIAPSPLANSLSATEPEPKPRPETVYDMEDAYGGIN
ncbi:hypothetical protein BDZ89DRAFT_1113483 [Hymenopellis radicata]|nr:hypothetical protein BDZ89DRAFT_1113483 [Hymenopellis radicata]